MILKEWRTKKKLTQWAVAQQMSVPQQTVWRLENGSIPGRTMARKIYVLTDGEVTPNDFHDLPDLKALAAEAPADSEAVAA